MIKFFNWFYKQPQLTPHEKDLQNRIEFVFQLLDYNKRCFEEGKRKRLEREKELEREKQQ